MSDKETRAGLFYRIAGKYYKIVDGHPKLWPDKEVELDMGIGKSYRDYIPKLDGGFVNKPSNTNYQQVINGRAFNISNPPPRHEAKTEDFPTIMGFIEHLTALSWKPEYLLDYLQLAWTTPEQKLPVLVLTSCEEGTGKTSFFNLLRYMFGDNTYIGSIHDITGQFTSLWASSLFVCLEESETDSKSQNDRIKQISTGETLKYEQKGVSASVIDNHVKLVLANNNEHKPVYITGQDSRYTILKVGKIKQFDPNFLKKIKEETGAFVKYLEERKLSTESKSRLWFDRDIIETKMSEVAKTNSQSSAESLVREVVEIISSQVSDGLVYLRYKELKTWAAHLGYDNYLKTSELKDAVTKTPGYHSYSAINNASVYYPAETVPGYSQSYECQHINRAIIPNTRFYHIIDTSRFKQNA